MQYLFSNYQGCEFKRCCSVELFLSPPIWSYTNVLTFAYLSFCWWTVKPFCVWDQTPKKGLVRACRWTCGITLSWIKPRIWVAESQRANVALENSTGQDSRMVLPLHTPQTTARSCGYSWGWNLRVCSCKRSNHTSSIPWPWQITINNAGERRVCSANNSRLLFITVGSQNRNSNHHIHRWKQRKKTKVWWLLACIFVSLTLLKTPCLGNDAAYNLLGR